MAYSDAVPWTLVGKHRCVVLLPALFGHLETRTSLQATAPHRGNNANKTKTKATAATTERCGKQRLETVPHSKAALTGFRVGLFLA